MTADPLYEAFFKPTTQPEIAAPPEQRIQPAPSDDAVRVETRASRRGYARSRVALMDGARRAVLTSGTRLTMAQVAAAAGVAKATLYNHFRTREDVLAALLVDEVEWLLQRHAGESIADALSGAARDLAAHPLLRSLGEREPATLAALARIDLASPLWKRVLNAIDEILAAETRGGAETVLRWLASFIPSPASGPEIAADLAILLAGLPDATPAQAAKPATNEAMSA